MIPLAVLITAILSAQDNFPYVPDSAPFPDVPRNHWAFEAVHRLKDEGILVGYPSGLMLQKKMDDSPANLDRVFTDLGNACCGGFSRNRDGLARRYEAAVSINAAIEMWIHKLTMLGTLVNKGPSFSIEDLRPYWIRRKILHAWLAELEPELRAIGVDPPALKKKLRVADETTWQVQANKHLGW